MPREVRMRRSEAVEDHSTMMLVFLFVVLPGFALQLFRFKELFCICSDLLLCCFLTFLAD